VPFDIVVLDHEERHLRRRVLTLAHGDEVLVDLPEPARLMNRDRLVLDDGRHVEVIAAEEDLYEVKAGGPRDLARLAWHIGNRHLAAEIAGDRILVRRDPVIRDMLVRLGASVAEVREPFQPEGGAYHGHAHQGGRHAHEHS